MLQRAAFSNLFEQIMSVSPMLRRQILQEKSILNHIIAFMRKNNEPTVVA